MNREIEFRGLNGTKWFFGALGEIAILLDNTIYLNAAHKITGLGFIFNTNCYYGSCSEYDYSHTWICIIGCSQVHRSCARKSIALMFVPFYASAKEFNKQEK